MRLLANILRRNQQQWLVSSAGFITPRGREEAARVMTGKLGITEHFPKSACRGGVSYDTTVGRKGTVPG